MKDLPAGELFFEKQRRIERENMEFIKLLGERDTEIARLREALQCIVVECDCVVDPRFGALRTYALSALERSAVHG